MIFLIMICPVIRHGRPEAIRSSIYAVIGQIALMANNFLESDYDDDDLSAFGQWLVANPLAIRILEGKRIKAGQQFEVVFERLSHEIESSPLIADVVTRWLNRNLPRSADSAEMVYQSIVLNGLAALGRSKSLLVISCVHLLSERFTRIQSAGIIRVLANVARQPIDPYASSEMVLRSRHAVVQLLINSSSLAEEVQRLRIPADEAWLSLMGTVLRSRTDPQGKQFSDLVMQWNLDDKGRTALAQAGNTRLNIEIPGRGDELPIRRLKVPRWTARILQIAIPPLLAIVAAMAAYWSLPGSPSQDIGAEVALGVLALVATVNVFTIQTSSGRVPEVISRTSGQPWQLTVSYSASVFLVFLTVVNIEDSKMDGAVGAASLTLLALSITFLLWAMFRLIYGTSASAAARSFARTRGSKHAKAAWGYGKIQAVASITRSAMQSVPVIQLASNPTPGERGTRVVAKERGFFLPSRKRLLKVLRNATFSKGTRLVVFGKVGVIAAQGESVAMLVEGKSQLADNRLLESVSVALETKSSKGLDEVTQACLALTGLALRLAREGDMPSASSAVTNVVSAVGEALTVARRARRREFFREELRQVARRNEGELRNDAASAAAAFRRRDDEAAIVFVPLQATITMIVSTRLQEANELGQVPEELLSRILEKCQRAESAIAIILNELIVVSEENIHCRGENLARVLRISGVRALEIGSPVEFNMVLTRARVLAQTTRFADSMRAVLAMLSATASRFAPGLSVKAMEGYLSSFPRSDESWELHLGLWRIGAVSLECGAYSVALKVVSHMAARGLRSSVLYSIPDEFFEIEGLHSTIHGSYMGVSPPDSLNYFRSFMRSLEPRL